MDPVAAESASAPATPPARPRRRATLARLVIILAVAIVVTLVGLRVLEPWLVYPRHAIPAAAPNARPGPGGERWALDLAEGWIRTLQRDEPLGDRIEAWFFAALLALGEPINAPSPRPVVVFFHGNAELIDNNIDLARTYTMMGLHVLLVEYPGYGRSAGKPTQESIGEVANAFIYVALLDKRVRHDVILLHGRSLGGGVAAQAARWGPHIFKTRRVVLILESTFTGIDDLAADMFIPRWFVRNPYRTREILPVLSGPVLILHGTSDTIIPIDHARKNAALARDATLVELPGGHNDLPFASLQYWAAIRQFIATNVPPPPPKPPTTTPDG